MREGSGNVAEVVSHVIKIIDLKVHSISARSGYRVRALDGTYIRVLSSLTRVADTRGAPSRLIPYRSRTPCPDTCPQPPRRARSANAI